MAYQVILAPRAFQDLENVVRYIALDSPVMAERFGKLLIEKVRSAGDFPWSGRVVPEFQDPRIREVIVKSYRIVYRVNEDAKTVEIARFWHAARGIPGLAEGEE